MCRVGVRCAARLCPVRPAAADLVRRLSAKAFIVKSKMYGPWTMVPWPCTAHVHETGGRGAGGVPLSPGEVGGETEDRRAVIAPPARRYRAEETHINRVSKYDTGSWYLSLVDLTVHLLHFTYILVFTPPTEPRPHYVIPTQARGETLGTLHSPGAALSSRWSHHH